jgi:hypothetical protein
MNLLLLASILCSFNSVAVEGGTLCYQLNPSAYYASYEGMKPDSQMIAFDANGISEALTTTWLNDYEMLTQHYSPETGCREWYGLNDVEATPCTLQ